MSDMRCASGVCDMEEDKKMPEEIKLSEQNGKLTLEINGIKIPNICGYRLRVDPNDSLVMKLTIDMEFFRSDVKCIKELPDMDIIKIHHTFIQAQQKRNVRKNLVEYSCSRKEIAKCLHKIRKN